MKQAESLLDAARSLVVCTPDHFGRMIGKRRPASDWQHLREHGLAMPDFHLITDIENRPLDGFSVAGVEHGFRNGCLEPDAEAAFVSPLEPGVPHVIGNALTSGGAAIAEAPRQILRAQIERLEAEGLTASCASELEFFAFRQSFAEMHRSRHSRLEPLYHRHGDNDVLVAGLAREFCELIEGALSACGIEVDQFQGEGGAGQFETNIRPTPPLEAADNHAVFKHVVKAAAHVAGQAVTFLAKPFETDAGSSGHVHISFRSADGKNALGAGETLSEFGRRFLAGLIAHTPELTLLHAPMVNSYKRLVPGSFTPLTATWGWDNRTAMVRLVSGADGPRIEFRLPGADVNPYHCYAAIFAAGLAGLRAGPDLPAEKRGGAEPESGPEIPRDLGEALDRFAKSRVAKEAFGEAVHAHLTRHGRHELAAARKAVTDWEIARGFEHA